MSYPKTITTSLITTIFVMTLGIFAINKSFANDSGYMNSNNGWHYGDNKHGMGFCGDRTRDAGDYMIYRIEKNMKFNPDQTAKWNNVKTAFESGRKNMTAICDEIQQNGRPEDAPARLALMEKVLSARLDTLQKAQPAVESLYASLDDAQKETFNKLTSRHRDYH